MLRYAPAALQSADPAIIRVTTSEEARALVQRELAAKPDLMKIWFIYSQGQKLDDLLPIVSTTIDESHDAGIRVAVHATQLEVARAAVENLRKLSEAGVTIAAGTYAGNIGTLHGPALHRELELMAEAGLAPRAILRAATLGSARLLGRDEELGTLEAGKFADLVVLDADPLADIRNARRVDRVMKGGKIFNPKEILANLNAQNSGAEAVVQRQVDAPCGGAAHK
ncbi:MAG: amidohydrolase family protein [Planctomycetota bacterium]